MPPMNAFASSRPSRREFMRLLGRGAAVGAFAGLAPRALSAVRKYRGAETAPRALVLVQLEGGNDGLNTIVPFHDDAYHRLRPTLTLAERDLIFLSDTTALNRAAGALESLFKDGKLAVVQNVGYAGQSPSHYRSAEVWHTASAADEVGFEGWAGRCLSGLQANGQAVSASYSSSFRPRVLWTESTPRVADNPPDLAPIDALAQVGEHAAASAATEVHFVSVPGFDTHFNQRDTHAERLRTVSTSLAALQRRLEQRGVADRVLTMVFSEFGRSAAENSQGGTDHGDVGPVFLLGTQIAGGLHHGRNGRCDFRRIVHSVATDWLGAPSKAIFARDPGRAGFLNLSPAT